MDTRLVILLLVVVGTVTEAARLPLNRGIQNQGCFCVTEPCDCRGDTNSPDLTFLNPSGCRPTLCFSPPCPCV
ncbi:hypothetical protein Pcinc_012965 [Petrolisthes cinctipes]|uniref:Uncharacterized protein n=1 Tax=Petrolisthes cinctipes TaxID=88211 RepID=A0AAE1KS22_PETCI|nr:hypothetical protein Pcinc_012965 [Petrolisthes cinctipes]